MNMEFQRKLPIPMDIKKDYPVPPAAAGVSGVTADG